MPSAVRSAPAPAVASRTAARSLEERAAPRYAASVAGRGEPSRGGDDAAGGSRRRGARGRRRAALVLARLVARAVRSGSQPGAAERAGSGGEGHAAPLGSAPGRSTDRPRRRVGTHRSGGGVPSLLSVVRDEGHLDAARARRGKREQLVPL